MLIALTFSPVRGTVVLQAQAGEGIEEVDGDALVGALRRASKSSSMGSRADGRADLLEMKRPHLASSFERK